MDRGAAPGRQLPATLAIMYQAVIRIMSQNLIIFSAFSDILLACGSIGGPCYRSYTLPRLHRHCSRTRTAFTFKDDLRAIYAVGPCHQVVDLYFEDSGSKLEKLDAQLASPTQPDYNAVDQLVRSEKASAHIFLH